MTPNTINGVVLDMLGIGERNYHIQAPLFSPKTKVLRKYASWESILRVGLTLKLALKSISILHICPRVVRKINDFGFLMVMVGGPKTMAKRNPRHFLKALVMGQGGERT